jgi:hypothetical protein
MKYALRTPVVIALSVTPEKFGAFIRAEMDRNGRIIKKLNLKME